MINQANEEKLNELDPDQRRDYENLKQENKTIIEHIYNIRKNLERVNARLTTLEAQLKVGARAHTGGPPEAAGAEYEGGERSPRSQEGGAGATDE